MNHHPRITIEVPGKHWHERAPYPRLWNGAGNLWPDITILEGDEKLPDFVAGRIARVSIVVGAHAAVADDEITFQELVEIYKGTKTRWKDGNEIIVQTENY